jgi:VWFA-related protein
LLAAQGTPKKNTTDDSSSVLRQTVRRVRVDVVVTDAQGKPVPGLHASDFRVAEDGKPQSVRQFEYHSDEMAEAALPKRPPLPPHTFMNLPVVPEHGPLTVLVWDLLNTPLGRIGDYSAPQLEAREPMVKFLKNIPGQRVAIFVLGDQLRFVQGFTSDPDLIDRAIGDPATKPQQPETSSPQYIAAMLGGMVGSHPSSAEADLIANVQKAEGEFAGVQMELRVRLTTDAFKQIARFLSAIPGRKNLIWYTGSIPINNHSGRDLFNAYRERIKEATDRLSSAEVSVYCIDARGLIGWRDWDFSKNTSEFATMDELSEQTDGRAFYNTNGLEEALETSSREGDSYYSLLYAPTNAKYDGSVRRISVHLEHEKYRLAYRRSYIAEDTASLASKQRAEEDSGTQDEAFASSVSEATDDQFGAPSSHQIVFAAHVDAIGQPTPATTEQMAALEPYREQMAKVEHRKFVPHTGPVPMQQYAIEYGVLASQLDIPKSADGRYHPDVTFSALAFNRDGETLWGTVTRIKGDIPAAKIDKIRKDGFQPMQTFFVPAGTAVIRLAVRDEHSERIGSMEIRLSLSPDQQQAANRQ